MKKLYFPAPIRKRFLISYKLFPLDEINKVYYEKK